MPRRSKSRSRSLFRSRQEEKRLIVSKVIKTTKDIKKVARIAKVSERTVYRCKRSLKARRTIKRKVGSGRVSTLNKRQKIDYRTFSRKTLFYHAMTSRLDYRYQLLSKQSGGTSSMLASPGGSLLIN